MVRRSLSLLRLLAGGLVAASAGCRHVAPAGSASFRFEAPSPPRLTPAPKEPPGDTRVGFTDAKPMGELPPPAYPQEALAARTGQVLVGVRLIVDREGRVSRIEPSLSALSTPSRFSAQFRAAVEEAVARWRFTPAQLLTLEREIVPRNKGGGEYWRLAGQEATETYFDVTFVFEASGRVRAPLASDVP